MWNDIKRNPDEVKSEIGRLKAVSANRHARLLTMWNKAPACKTGNQTPLCQMFNLWQTVPVGHLRQQSLMFHRRHQAKLLLAMMMIQLVQRLTANTTSRLQRQTR